MEILLLAGIGALIYVGIKRSRGEPVSAGRMAGGCLGFGCLGLVVLFIAGVILLWVLLQAIGNLDVSLSDYFQPENGSPGPADRLN